MCVRVRVMCVCVRVRGSQTQHTGMVIARWSSIHTLAMQRTMGTKCLDGRNTSVCVRVCVCVCCHDRCTARVSTHTILRM